MLSHHYMMKENHIFLKVHLTHSHLTSTKCYQISIYYAIFYSYFIHLLFLIMNYNYLTNFLQTSLLPNANLILLVYMNIKDVTHLN